MMASCRFKEREPNITMFYLGDFHKADAGFAIGIEGGQLQA
jgi:hypothetical protein